MTFPSKLSLSSRDNLGNPKVLLIMAVFFFCTSEVLAVAPSCTGEICVALTPEKPNIYGLVDDGSGVVRLAVLANSEDPRVSLRLHRSVPPKITVSRLAEGTRSTDERWEFRTLV